jgi:hypothetical protein
MSVALRKVRAIKLIDARLIEIIDGMFAIRRVLRESVVSSPVCFL